MMPTRVENEAAAMRAGSKHAPLLITCEHASAALPRSYRWHPDDQHLRTQHWAYDPGAAEISVELAERLDATAILARFTRLLVDLNRPTSSDTLFRTHADGHRLHLNHELAHGERDRRVQGYYDPYHETVDRTVGAVYAETVLSVHTFTPCYEGQVRTMEIGVLFDEEEALARRLAERLSEAGMKVALNEPYSGREGFIYAVERHASAHSRRAIEIEVRQDRATDPTFRRRLVALLADLFGSRS